MSILWQYTRGAVILQYGMLGLFTAQALAARASFSPGWWQVAILAAALSGLIFFWPVRRA